MSARLFHRVAGVQSVGARWIDEWIERGAHPLVHLHGHEREVVPHPRVQRVRAVGGQLHADVDALPHGRRPLRRVQRRVHGALHRLPQLRQRVAARHRRQPVAPMHTHAHHTLSAGSSLGDAESSLVRASLTVSAKQPHFCLKELRGATGVSQHSKEGCVCLRLCSLATDTAGSRVEPVESGFGREPIRASTGEFHTPPRASRGRMSLKASRSLPYLT
jgi:hypothetical protein